MKLKGLSEEISTDEIVLEGKGADHTDVCLYGIEEESEEYVRIRKQLKHIKNADPALYNKILNLD